ncbi:MAG: hypothetical protein DWQ10_04395 [Calditrichaeota bacterium]|nr:MAG: hypothetical protein DWQ10_04395 [Calditrichota bacterium]
MKSLVLQIIKRNKYYATGLTMQQRELQNKKKLLIEELYREDSNNVQDLAICYWLNKSNSAKNGMCN